MANQSTNGNGIIIPDALDIGSLERALGLRAWEWPGHCFEIAHALVAKVGIDGRPVYGFWTGPVASTKFFDGTARKVRHGWVVTRDNRIVDPTRFVFECAAPYLYIGPNDHYRGGQSISWQVSPSKSTPVPLKMN